MRLSEEDWKREFVSNKINNSDIPLPSGVGRTELFKINLKGCNLDP
jgi:hypothetical protein